MVDNHPSDKRVQDPRDINDFSVPDRVARGEDLIVQFGESGYSPELLTQLNELCKTSEGKLEIRFYGHHNTEFDCSVLSYIPDVRYLSIETQETSNLHTLSCLHHLCGLALRIYYLENPNILDLVDLANLEELSLDETRISNLDLQYLSSCPKLRSLHIHGHKKNIEVVSLLSQISYLALSGMKQVPLGFVNSLPILRMLNIHTGGRKDILEIDNQNIQVLLITRVLGLSELGDLGRFPKLTRIGIREQKQLDEINFSEANVNVEDIQAWICKSLSAIRGLKYLDHLYSIDIRQTSIDFHSFIQHEFPTSLTEFSFSTGRIRADREIRNILQENGYEDYRLKSYT